MVGLGELSAGTARVGFFGFPKWVPASAERKYANVANAVQ